MLTIRAEQFEVLGRDARQRADTARIHQLRERLLREAEPGPSHLENELQASFAALAHDAQDRLLRQAVREGRDLGLRAESDLYLYAMLVLRWGAQFRTDAALVGWTRAFDDGAISSPALRLHYAIDLSRRLERQEERNLREEAEFLFSLLREGA